MSKVCTPDPEGFELFWKVWGPHMRHTDGKGDARNTYRKHLLAGAEPQEMIDGATGFFRFMPEKDKPYVPLAASWLNKEAYPDWAMREREYQRELARPSNVTQLRPVLPATHFQNTYRKEG